jgi:membrane associated rhomboid family serine protease
MSYYRYSNSSYQRPSLFGGFRFFPPVIKTLLITNVAVYFFAGFLSAFHFQGKALTDAFASLLYLFPIGDGFQPWQLFTYMFMHGGLMHLLFNMLALWMFGMELENTWGSKKFLTYYLMCGVGAGLSTLFIGPLFAPPGPTVGASGAIYGVLIAFGILFPERPIFIYFLLPIKARYFVLLYIALEVYAGVNGTADGVAHFAHLGGAAVGYVYLLIDQRRLPFSSVIRRAKERVVASHQPAGGYDSNDIVDANYYDIVDREERINQKRVDEILDKISQSGYQSLSDEEKKILFEASKKLN